MPFDDRFSPSLILSVIELDPVIPTNIEYLVLLGNHRIVFDGDI